MQWISTYGGVRLSGEEGAVCIKACNAKDDSVPCLTDCMVFNLGQNYEWTDQQGIVLYGSAVYQGITYGIW